MDFDRSKVIFLFQGMLALVAVGLVLKYAAAAILPLTLAWLLSHLIEPAVDFSTRRKIPASLAIFLIPIVLFGQFCNRPAGLDCLAGHWRGFSDHLGRDGLLPEFHSHRGVYCSLNSTGVEKDQFPKVLATVNASSSDVTPAPGG